MTCADAMSQFGKNNVCQNDYVKEKCCETCAAPGSSSSSPAKSSGILVFSLRESSEKKNKKKRYHFLILLDLYFTSCCVHEKVTIFTLVHVCSHRGLFIHIINKWLWPSQCKRKGKGIGKKKRYT